jgi:hypothetical protein
VSTTEAAEDAVKSTNFLACVVVAALGLSAAPAFSQGAVARAIAPSATPTPKPTPAPDPVVHIGCVKVNILHDVQGTQNWTVRAVNLIAWPTDVRREVGAQSDRLWCGYEVVSQDDGSVRTKAYTVLDAPTDHPKCVAEPGKVSFACRRLTPGETY